MKTRYLLWIWVVGTMLWIGCGDDSGTLSPSDAEEYRIEIAGGNHDFDVKIKEWNDRTGLYILYRFDPREVYFNGNDTWTDIYIDTVVESERYYPLGEDVYVEGDFVFINSVKFQLGWATALVNGRKEHVGLTGDGQVRVRMCKISYMGSISVAEAEVDYVGRQLAWVEEMFLNFYPDSVLRETIPIKVILGKGLEYSSGPVTKAAKAFHYSFHNLIFSYGDENIETLTTIQKRETKAELHKWFINDRVKKRFISFEEFEAAAPYPSTVPPANDCYKLGFLIPTTLPDQDAETFLAAIIQTSYARLTQEPASANHVYNDYTGVLHPKKDVNGLIREKYNILINEFRKIGVNLQAVGDLYGE